MIVPPAKLVLVGDSVDMRIDLIDVCSYTWRFLLNSRIDLRNNRDSRIDLRRVGSNLS